MTESLLAAGKLTLTFAVILILLRLRLPLWLTITAGSFVVAVTCGIPSADWPGMAFDVLLQKDFCIISLMIFLIMLLSSVQEATGQSRLLVEGLKQHLRRPRLRLVLFPALIGLLPMPGGALFSCPMVRATASDMGISEEKKAQINYWFRHIWELAWPLYPGYVLTSSLLDIPLSRLCQITFPLVPLAFAVGWYFLMRNLRPGTQQTRIAAQDAPPSLGQVLLHALPIAVTLIGASIFTQFFTVIWPDMPSQLNFSLALFCAILTALWQGRGRWEKPPSSLVFTANARKMLVLLYAIFVFKHTIMISGMIQSLGNFGDSPLTVIVSFALLPFIGGLLTGLMVGFIGVSFPVLLGILKTSPLQEYTVPLIILGLAAGNVGQLLSPLHVCLVVTSEFFSTSLGGMLRALCVPVIVLFCGGLCWALLALALGVHL